MDEEKKKKHASNSRKKNLFEKISKKVFKRIENIHQDKKRFKSWEKTVERKRFKEKPTIRNYFLSEKCDWQKTHSKNACEKVFFFSFFGKNLNNSQTNSQNKKYGLSKLIWIELKFALSSNQFESRMKPLTNRIQKLSILRQQYSKCKRNTHNI